MKKLTTSLLFILSLVFISNTAFAQCTPDPNCTDPDGDGEFCPTEFPFAVEDEYYDQTLTVIAPVEQQGIQLHHIDILDIVNIPPGMEYQCQDNDCSFYPAVAKCVNVYGTPEIGSWGTYTLYLSIEIFMDVAGFPVSLGIIEDSSAWVVIQPKIHADFEINLIDDYVMCIEDQYEVNYIGNATADAIYNWNFSENIDIISGEGQGPYIIQANNPGGEDSITLYVEQEPYTSPQFSKDFFITVCGGIEEEKDWSFIAQPNPFKDHILIEGLSRSANQIEVYDLMGRKIKSIISHDNNILLDLTELQKGIYLLSVTNGQNTETQKIVKK